MDRDSVSTVKPNDLSPASTGDDSVIESMVREHSSAIHAYLARRVGRSTADDLLSEVWIRAVRSLPNLDPDRDCSRPWLYGIARNVLRAHWRQEPSTDSAGLPPIDPWEGVDERLDAERLGNVLQEGLARLAARDREVLLLVAWEGLNASEVAVVVGTRPGTARSRLHRARRQLQDHLDSALSGMGGA